MAFRWIFHIVTKPQHPILNPQLRAELTVRHHTLSACVIGVGDLDHERAVTELLHLLVTRFRRQVGNNLRKYLRRAPAIKLTFYDYGWPRQVQDFLVIPTQAAIILPLPAVVEV